ncbi:MAG TPA: hypothetical protein DD379_18745, partial [Cyanobacteria bacterium UBA11162]|nr:hypothetical protein [Cyanobacteria bacterium UBA11162]
MTLSSRSHSLPDSTTAWHTQSVEQSLSELDSSDRTGLTSQQAAERLQH